MHKERLLEIARTILACPTAPFHEAAVRAAITALLSRCQRVELRQDDFGNLIAHYRGTDLGAPARHALCAHMDHPAWVRPDLSAESVERVFLGGVPASYLERNRERVRDFGAFSMWDLPECETRDGRIYSRACDDLIGCVAIVWTLERLDAARAPGSFYGLFTRAEEVGFAGAVELARSGWLARENVTVISLETSSERPPAKMGDGPIVRVGDKTSVFDHVVTAELLAAAEKAGITVQRCLMSGGSCEATAFRLYGVRCGALCVALGNYHNCGPDERIEPEYVSVDDVSGLADLCFTLANPSTPTTNPDNLLRERLEARLLQYGSYHDRDQAVSSHE